MKASDSNDKSTQLAARAIRRAAKKVLGQAVHDNKPVPLWDGEKVVWKVPTEEFEQMNSADGKAASET